jgi:hypothetical protein
MEKAIRPNTALAILDRFHKLPKDQKPVALAFLKSLIREQQERNARQVKGGAA